jgi:hypothetical protein
MYVRSCHEYIGKPRLCKFRDTPLSGFNFQAGEFRLVRIGANESL